MKKLNRTSEMNSPHCDSSFQCHCVIKRLHTYFMGGKIFIEKFTHSEIKPVNQMIKSHTAMVRVLELGVLFTAYLLKHRYLSENNFKCKFN